MPKGTKIGSSQANIAIKCLTPVHAIIKAYLELF
jgi:hypothetical protein